MMFSSTLLRVTPFQGPFNNLSTAGIPNRTSHKYHLILPHCRMQQRHAVRYNHFLNYACSAAPQVRQLSLTFELESAMLSLAGLLYASHRRMCLQYAIGSIYGRAGPPGG